ncbi:MAG TPA: hypothetical protein VMT82_11470, partial [candidate division Zixibacteria bacterium]|nr:hypothetical protein [candidate division Zixibacteria bacterium]
LVPAAAAFPWGALILSFPGGRNGAFVFVALLGLINALSIYWILRVGDRRQGSGGVFMVALGLLLLLVDMFLSTKFS